MKKMMLSALTLSAMLGMSLAASPAEAGPRFRARTAFHPADTNRDGFVSRRELRRYDRKIARLSARRAALRRRPVFHPADFNRDGVVSRAEALHHAKRNQRRYR